MLSRRDLLRLTGGTWLAAASAPFTRAIGSLSNYRKLDPLRCINVVNFLRGDEPRLKIDLFLPLVKQMETVLEYNLPATWLLQYDALVSGPYVEFLKAKMPSSHEVGFWFEMNEMLCDAAKVDWRGRPGYEWDYNPPVAFTIGYTPDERKKLVDAAMKGFKQIWGHFPKSVASWNLDAISVQYLVENYSVEAFAVCRDQIATDGFTVWGAPIAGYYPSTVNSWSPALAKEHQINAPIFRMLGQDPVYYYYNEFKMPKRGVVSPPDTMEPVWGAGQDRYFVKQFLKMISEEPCLQFAYAQLGQENNFGWPRISKSFPMQMALLSGLAKTGLVHVETLGETGRRFKTEFEMTPSQAQVMLEDPFGNEDPPENTIWYQSRFYRANLHFKGKLPFFRDITVYSDKFPQPYLQIPTKKSEVDQRLPSVLDSYHWAEKPGGLGTPLAGAFIIIGDERAKFSDNPRVDEMSSSLSVNLPIASHKSVEVRFDEHQIHLKLNTKKHFKLSFQFQLEKSTLQKVEPHKVHYLYNGFSYFLKILKGNAASTTKGFEVNSSGGEIILVLSQE